jgi:hypothetical protein
MLVQDRFGHQHRLSDYIGPSIPSGLISHKDARMPRESRWARNFNAATAASFNRCCALAPDLESMFRYEVPKILLQQYRHL